MPASSESPPRVAWKYVWGNNSNVSNSSAGHGVGSAASERLYRAAAPTRASRERLQREVSEPRPASARAKTSAETKRQADAVAERFSHVLASTAAGRCAKEVISLAAVAGGAAEGDRVRDASNYGDMLFQEGVMQKQRKEEERERELRRREEAELREKCPFKPTVTPSAEHYVQRGHISERLEEVTMAHRERMQVLADVVRYELERDHTFKPSSFSKKSQAIVSGYGDFLDEMKQRDESHD
jgi:pyruvate/2-oxoglutarate dehydrogenase complex dihydrolipoamide acyltransferase (E2) component